MAKSFEEKVRQEVNRRMEAYRRSHSEKSISLESMLPDVRIRHELKELVKHTTWLQEKDLATWAILGVNNEEYICFCTPRSMFTLAPIGSNGEMELQYTGASGAYIQGTTLDVPKQVMAQPVTNVKRIETPFGFNSQGFLQVAQYAPNPRTTKHP